jgi:hypothetical protein
MKCNRTGCDQQAQQTMCVELNIGRLGQEYDIHVCGDHALDIRRMRRQANGGGPREWNGSSLVSIATHPDAVPF